MGDVVQFPVRTPLILVEETLEDTFHRIIDDWAKLPEEHRNREMLVALLVQEFEPYDLGAS